MNLRVPGPTPCPDEVLASASQQMINHRGPEFKDLIFRVTGNLQRAFETKNDVLTLTASGTAALEAAIVNTLSPGDKVLAVVVGSSASGSPRLPRPTARRWSGSPFLMSALLTRTRCGRP